MDSLSSKLSELGLTWEMSVGVTPGLGGWSRAGITRTQQAYSILTLSVPPGVTNTRSKGQDGSTLLKSHSQNLDPLWIQIWIQVPLATHWLLRLPPQPGVPSQSICSGRH